jgi:hypothetical protein
MGDRELAKLFRKWTAISDSFSAYGLVFKICARALRSFTDETISMALVIFCVLRMLLIRRLISRGVGMEFTSALS